MVHDLNTGIAADADDVALMIDASVGLITPDSHYDLNVNGVNADAGDYAMLQDASYIIKAFEERFEKYRQKRHQMERRRYL